MTEPKTRNSINGITPPDTDQPGVSAGVGGRHENTPIPPGGGGYLDNCTDFKNRVLSERANKTDPRLDELKKFGLNHQWVFVAQAVGFDVFMAFWQILDELEQRRHPYEIPANIRIRLPRFDAYIRHQRNLWVRRLAVEEKLTLSEIKNMLKRYHGETISTAHLCRIIKKVSNEAV